MCGYCELPALNYPTFIRSVIVWALACTAVSSAGMWCHFLYSVNWDKNGDKIMLNPTVWIRFNLLFPWGLSVMTNSLKVSFITTAGGSNKEHLNETGLFLPMHMWKYSLIPECTRTAENRTCWRFNSEIICQSLICRTEHWCIVLIYAQLFWFSAWHQFRRVKDKRLQKFGVLLKLLGSCSYLTFWWIDCP